MQIKKIRFCVIIFSFMSIPSSDLFPEFIAELLFSTESVIKYVSLDHSISDPYI